MSAAVVATPQRPLPGGFISTPAPQPSTIFAAQAASLRQAHAPKADAAVGDASSSTLSSVERAANTIGDALAAEARFPDLESYVGQGVSGDYELPSSAAWEPFQKLRLYDIPPAMIQQSNQSMNGLQTGIFAPLSHCWAIMDNFLYLWDYTQAEPELVGYEELQHQITGVQLVRPKPGVFRPDITHLIVVATQSQMHLLAVAHSVTAAGAHSVALFNTRMHIPTGGLNVTTIEASAKSHRIFFLDGHGEDIYEFHYQSEEGWFRGKCSRICHTRSQYDYFPAPVKMLSSIVNKSAVQKFFIQLVIDDSRDLMYTLSNTNEIKVWTLRDQVRLALARPLTNLLQTTGHFSARTDLLYSNNVRIVSINAIPASEAGKLSLLATTNTGCRLYLSATRGYGFPADGQNGPNSMQILHIRFPPRDGRVIEQPTPSTQLVPAQNANVDTNSRVLDQTKSACRYPPGYFFAFQEDLTASTISDQVFCTAPDFARLKNPQDAGPLNTRFSEFGQWIRLPGELSGIAPTTPDFVSTSCHELAGQFDQASPEMVIMTSSGVQTLRRRRLVDVFATMLRGSSNDDEGREGDIKRFVRMYGRGETAATAIAVACGQGLDAPDDNLGRVSNITDPDVLEVARRVFIEQGGKPEYNANAVIDRTADPLDSVRLSPRHEGLSLYICRLVRSIWSSTVIQQKTMPGKPLQMYSTIPAEKLRKVQRDLIALSDFLDRNRSLIEGLAGPQALHRATNRQEEIALQGEHRAMSSLVQLIGSIIEGIAFVLVLFDERVEDIVLALPAESQKKTLELQYHELFSMPTGRELAKELVKAIVNRNIANGSNVDTVADALRRRCGSFCSADDVVIFKAQEQVKRASEAGSGSETGRVLLNESQRLFTKVAGSLHDEVLHWTVGQYVDMAFYAGAIQLCLAVAHERDRAQRAASWIRDGMPDRDERQTVYEDRKRCYDLIFSIIQALDTATLGDDTAMASRRRNEAYDVINASDDITFQSNLYDWYIATGKADRLLDMNSRYVVDYLGRRAEEDRVQADLLWRYYVHHNEHLKAAATQLELARSHFPLDLEERMVYLSRAHTNASTRTTILTDSRQDKQQLLRQISDLIEVATIQGELVQKFKSDPRLQGPRRDEVLDALSMQGIRPVDELFNNFSDQAGYHDINLQIFQVADHRNMAEIRSAWEQLITSVHENAVAQKVVPWELVGDKVREMGYKLQRSENTFPISILLPLLERYAVTMAQNNTNDAPPQYWAIEVFLELDTPPETLMPVLEQIYYGNEHPFTGSKRRILASHLVFLIGKWVDLADRAGERFPCGSEDNAVAAKDCLDSLLRGRDLADRDRVLAEGVRRLVERY
ncbi:nucleoporin-domain-containing protein [Piedraia hortae CBS 480.64]|uniref:Nucleoporin-domain-containing protein n=1 Tax=Piedraia hortae CBS 480.64 TaxID=1314780 RepID=A0A6A7CDS9_9PEZI|nr:nucleoporin-domain-containing protein [Piedraia hortae CBS 480.64]